MSLNSQHDIMYMFNFKFLLFFTHHHFISIIFITDIDSLVYHMYIFYPPFISIIGISKYLMLFGGIFIFSLCFKFITLLILNTLYFWNHSTLLYVYPAHLHWPRYRIQTYVTYSGRKISGSRKYVQSEYTVRFWRGCAKMFFRWLYHFSVKTTV